TEVQQRHMQFISRCSPLNSEPLRILHRGNKRHHCPPLNIHRRFLPNNMLTIRKQRWPPRSLHSVPLLLYPIPRQPHHQIPHHSGHHTPAVHYLLRGCRRITREPEPRSPHSERLSTVHNLSVCCPM